VGIYRQEEEEEEAGLILGVEAKIVARLSGWAPSAIIGLLPTEQNRPPGVYHLANIAPSFVGQVVYTSCLTNISGLTSISSRG
jgi:hypothetical protein